MANINNTEISKKVQEHILHSFDSYEDMMAELQNHRVRSWNSPNFGGDMVDSGSFLVYTDDIRKFLHGLTGESLEVQKNKYTQVQTYNYYRNLINQEAPNILSENNRSYIKPNQQHEDKEISSINKENTMRVQLKETEISTANDIKIGYSNFKLIPLSQGIIIYDELKDNGFFLGGNLNSAAIIKDMKNYFSEDKINIKDIADYVWKNKLENKLLDSTHKNIYSKISVIGGAYLNMPGNDQYYNSKELQKSGYVQGVCECVAIVSENDKTLANKLLAEMKVTKTMAKKYANPETYKELEQTVFAPKIEQKNDRGRHR